MPVVIFVRSVVVPAASKGKSVAAHAALFSTFEIERTESVSERGITFNLNGLFAAYTPYGNAVRQQYFVIFAVNRQRARREISLRSKPDGFTVEIVIESIYSFAEEIFKPLRSQIARNLALFFDNLSVFAVEISTDENLLDTRFVCDAVTQTFGNGRVVKNFTHSFAVLEIYRIRENVLTFFYVYIRILVSFIVFRLFKIRFFAVKRLIARLLLFDYEFCGIISVAYELKENLGFSAEPRFYESLVNAVKITFEGPSVLRFNRNVVYNERILVRRNVLGNNRRKKRQIFAIADIAEFKDHTRTCGNNIFRFAAVIFARFADSRIISRKLLFCRHHYGFFALVDDENEFSPVNRSI